MIEPIDPPPISNDVHFRHEIVFANFVTYLDTTIQTTANFFTPLNVKSVIGDYTVTEADVTGNWLIRVFAATGTEAIITIPPYDFSTFNVPEGSNFMVSSSGLGTVTINDNGIYLQYPPAGRSIVRKFGRIFVVKTNLNAWDIDGQLGV